MAIFDRKWMWKDEVKTRLTRDEIRRLNIGEIQRLSVFQIQRYAKASSM